MNGHELIVVGDVHLQDRLPKKYQCLDFLEWLFNQDFNNENNSILFLGDLCEINSTPELYEVYVDYFVNKSKFEKIFVLQGNHDCVNQSTILSIFRPLPKVEIIINYKAYKYYNCNLLLLPYYNHEGTDLTPMTEFYSNLDSDISSLTQGFTDEFDYGFGHIEDDTEHFSKKFCDTSKLKVKTWLNGHIHTASIQKGGHYLGAPILNSFTESGKTPYIAKINGESKEYELIEVPKWMEYYEVEYPDKLPKIDTKYGIFLVKNSLDKNTTVEEYTKQAKEMGFDFYTRRIQNKKSKTVEIGEAEKTEKLTFDDFSKTVGLDSDIYDICNNVIRLKNGD